PGETLFNTIIAGRLKLDDRFTKQMRKNSIRHFLKIRELPGLDKVPATAELLAWMRVLEINQLDVGERSRAEDLKRTYVTLGKTDKDLKTMKEALDKGVTIPRQ